MRILVLILVSAVVAACGDAVRVVKQTIALQEAFFRQIDKRSPTPEIRDRLRALARAGAGDSVQLLVTHGLVRLNDSTLIRRMELMSVMLEGSEESVCAALSRGTPGSGQMTLAMTELEGPALEDWAALLIEAQIASIEARPARHVTQEPSRRSPTATKRASPRSSASIRSRRTAMHVGPAVPCSSRVPPCPSLSAATWPSA